MLRYKAGYKFTDTGVHLQMIDSPAVITCGKDWNNGRRMDITEGIRFDHGGSIVTGPPL